MRYERRIVKRRARIVNLRREVYLATVRDAFSREILTSDRCPSCSAPMVGTRPTDSFAPRHRLMRRRRSGMVLTVSIIGNLAR